MALSKLLLIPQGPAFCVCRRWEALQVRTSAQMAAPLPAPAASTRPRPGTGAKAAGWESRSGREAARGYVSLGGGA